MNATPAHHQKFDCRTEMDARLAQMVAEWRFRKWVRFVAVDPRTTYQREAGAKRLARERQYAEIWLAANRGMKKVLKAQRDEASARARRTSFRVIAGGRL